MVHPLRSWRSRAAGVLFGLVLAWPTARADSPEPPLSSQFAELGRQALAQGAAPAAQTFFQKALQLDPTNKAAARGLEESQRAAGAIVRVASRVPADDQEAAAAPLDQPAAPPDTRATIEQSRGRREHRPAAVDQRRRAAASRPPANS